MRRAELGQVVLRPVGSNSSTRKVSYRNFGLHRDWRTLLSGAFFPTFLLVPVRFP
jgi:hypothetical protein